MSGMFGKTAIDQRAQNLNVGSTLVADKVFVKNLNFNETNYIHGIREDLPVELVEGEFHALPYFGNGPFRYTAIFPPQDFSINLYFLLLFTNDINNYSDTCTFSVFFYENNERRYIISDARVSDLNLGVSVGSVDYEHVQIGDSGTTVDSIEVPANVEIILESTCEINRPLFRSWQPTGTSRSCLVL
jgi:hypothetical protein